MFADMTVLEAIKTFWPLLTFDLSLAIWALVDLVRRERVRHLPKLVWALIIAFVQPIGAVAYLIVGRAE